MANAGLHKHIVEGFFAALPDGSPLVQDLCRAAAVVFDVSSNDVLGRSREASICEARGAGMVLAVRKRGLAYSFVGHYLGRDHTTVLHACNLAVRRIMSEPVYARLVEDTWVLAIKGRAEIVRGEQERIKRLRAEFETERKQEAAKEIVKARSRVTSPNKAQKKAKFPHVDIWTKNQLAEMNKQFEAHMMVNGNGASY